MAEAVLLPDYAKGFIIDREKAQTAVLISNLTPIEESGRYFNK